MRAAGLILVLGIAANTNSGAAQMLVPEPTYSIKITEINNKKLCGTGVARTSVAPGDRLRLDVFLRDWSPNGDMAGAVQAQLDHASFSSGDSGTIQPIGYESTTLRSEENPGNVFTDTEHDLFIHNGFVTLSIVNSNSLDPGHRWISVISQGQKGPVSRQDGTERYIGTVKCQVSKDATGTFTFMLVAGNDFSGILDFQQQFVGPPQVESAEITVTDAPNRTWIMSSTPDFRTVDARSPKATSGIDGVSFRMSETSDIGTFTISAEGADAPGVKSTNESGKSVRIAFDAPLPEERWTTITHDKSGTSTVIGRFAGDVNQNGALQFDDLDYFISRFNERGTLPKLQGDLNADGRIGAADLLWLLNALYG